nr:hypothetical protein [Tepidimonas alkaliphilus]
MARPATETAVLWLHPQAPPKPPPGAPCNGCGVCCAWQPCPLGWLVSRRRQGPCAALHWDEPTARYRCGLLNAATPQSGLTAMRRAWRRFWQAAVARWIAAGRGCDCDVQTKPMQAEHGRQP